MKWETPFDIKYIGMKKSQSPGNKFDNLESTSTKARFFYSGVFAIVRSKGQVSPPKTTSYSQDKRRK